MKITLLVLSMIFLISCSSKVKHKVHTKQIVKKYNKEVEVMQVEAVEVQSVNIEIVSESQKIVNHRYNKKR